MTEPVLCVDFGTSTTQATLVTAAGAQPLHDPASGSTSWPTAVFADDDALLVGRAAEKRKRVRPGAYRHEFKRELGQSAALVVGGAPFDATHLLTVLLRALRAEAERLLGGPVGAVLMTMPASYGPDDPRRAALLTACGNAGLGIAELLPEPVAAALAPAAGSGFKPGELVLVYDLGGGTFDTALVRLGAARHEIVGFEAVEDCGGRDLDAAVYAAVLDKLGRPDPLRAGNVERDAALRARLDLMDLAVELKHQLSDGPTAGEFTRDDQLVEMTRDELGKLAVPLVERTLECCRALLVRCEVAPDEIAGVLAVGGSTRSPVIAAAVAAGLGLPVRQAEDPQHAAVRGACEWARQTPHRTIAGAPPGPGVNPLAWTLPGGRATVVERRPEGTDFAAGEALARVRAADGSLHQLVAGSPGRILHWQALLGQRVLSGDWLVTTRSAVATAPRLVAGSKPRRFTIGANRLRAIAFSPDGRYFAVIGTGGCMLFAVTGPGRLNVRAAGIAKWLAFGADGTTLLTGSGADVKAFRVLVPTPDGLALAGAVTEVTAPDVTPPPAPDVVSALAPGARLLAVVMRRRIVVWSLDAGTTVLNLATEGSVDAIAFSRDGSRLAVGSSESGSVDVYSITSAVQEE
ncbi:Hsp70 family protein [Dactylosporangium sp. CS-033363]|uniref:Hsp70 family protein n=1 Tax=Dactylosporangium sp. CS-033363 TaxID=3239935 RepID=UPI003D922064